MGSPRRLDRVRRAAVAAGAVLAAVCGLVVGIPGTAHAEASDCSVNSTPAFSETINGTPGDDIISCVRGVNPGTTINAGAGNDDILVLSETHDPSDPGQPANRGVINAGSGDDTIRVFAGLPDATGTGAIGNDGTINGGTGNDTIRVTGGGGYVSGDHEIRVGGRGGEGNNRVIDGGG
ncbi:hypothetical protein, partial [Streptomyces jumonjinensis]|uniref:hypothetical protein n=1 Tax=Streptomyces jumonjinensis TaxID=1945 RepID=UPI001E5EA506